MKTVINNAEFDNGGDGGQYRVSKHFLSSGNYRLKLWAVMVP